MTRPELHATPARGWLNDAHGIAYHGGRYHLFHQAVPDDLAWRPWLSWGHLSSADLITWTTHPAALTPGDGDHGCWSGDLLVTGDGSPALFYTAVAPPDLGLGAVRIARPADDDWMVWRKGPVVVRAPRDLGLVVFRDPTVVRDGDRWRMLVGAGHGDGRAAVLGFVSTDLETWEFTGTLLERPGHLTHPFWTGEGWECPHLFSVGEHDVVVVSVWDARGGGSYVAAAVGRLAGDRFETRSWQRLTHGPAPYAPTVFTDAEGRSCLMFWLRGVADPGAGWTGALGVPYLVDVDAGGTVRLEPHPAVWAARRPERALGLTWGAPGRPPSGRLDLRCAEDSVVATLTARDGVLRVNVDGVAEPRIPLGDGPVRVLADGPALEVCTGVALFGRSVSRRVVSAGHGDGSVEAWWT